LAKGAKSLNTTISVTSILLFLGVIN